MGKEQSRWQWMLLAISLVALMVLSVGCGSAAKKDAKQDQEIVVEHVDYQAAFYPAEEVEQVGAVVFHQDTMYYPAYSEADSGEVSVTIYRVDLKTMDHTRFYRLDRREESVSVRKMAVKTNGDLVLLNRVGSSEKNIVGMEDSAGMVAASDPEYGYELMLINTAGNLLKQYDITDVLQSSKAGQSAYVQAIVVDEQGNYYLYVSGDENVVLVLDAETALLQEITCEDQIGTLAQDAQGQVILMETRSSVDGWQTVLRHLTAGSGMPQEQNGPRGLGGIDLVVPMGENTLLFSSQDRLYQYDQATGVCTEILYWLDANVNPSSLCQMAVMKDGRIVALTQDIGTASSFGVELVVLQDRTTISAEEGQNGDAADEGQQSGDSAGNESVEDSGEEDAVTILTLGVLQSDIFLDDWIVQYNRSYDDVHIKVRTYGDGDPIAAMTKLNADIVAGNAPDMMDLSDLDLNMYVSKEALIDMYPYLEADESLRTEDFVPGVLEMNEINGGLYGITPSFRLETMGGLVSALGQPEDWTVDQVKKLLETLPEDVNLFQNLSSVGILRYMLSLGMEEFIDWEAGTCSFDSEEFIELLELASQVEPYMGQESDYVLVQQGRLLTMRGWFSDVGEFLVIRAMYEGEDVAFVGIPSAEGGKSIIDPSHTFGITTACEDPEAAWDVISSFMSEDYQRSLHFEIPSRTSILAEMFTRYQGGTHSGPDYVITTSKPTQDDIDDFYEMMEDACGMPGFNLDVWNIISEEAEAYFAGDKTAKDVADIIQNRVSVYVSENR